ncbi:MAG: CPBP family intramembrane metalloprotease [Clostridia bacterium]|nr:CPBP family intramembrane metalloprotease [Clostridia bacterium]
MKSKNALYAPALLCVIYILTGFSKTLMGFFSGLSDSNILLSVIIIQCVVFLLPVAFYCRVRNINIVTALNFKPVSPSCIGFAVVSFFLYFAGAALIKFVSQAFMGAQISSGVPLMEAYPEQGALILIAYVVLPALLEELVFRSIVIHEYTPYGGFFAIGVSALFFAMLHFSFKGLAGYFLAGIVFAAMTFVCSSVIPAIILHLANNALDVFMPDVFSEYVSRTGNSTLLFFILTTVFLLLLCMWLGQLEFIYSKKSAEVGSQKRAQLLFLESEKKLREQEKKPAFSKRAAQVFLSPGLIAAVIIFILKAINVI